MTLKTNRRRDWLIAVGYILFIYVTLNVAGEPLRFLRGHGWLKVFLAGLYAAALFGFLLILKIRGSLRPARVFMLCALFAAYLFLSRYVTRPEEQIHFFEYGLVGVFLLRALRHHILTWLRFPLAILMSAGAGWVDELIQGTLPTRHYDIHDVFLNIISSILGLMIFFVLSPDATANPPSS